MKFNIVIVQYCSFAIKLTTTTIDTNKRDSLRGLPYSFSKFGDR